MAFADLLFRNKVTLRFAIDNLLNRGEDAVAISCDANLDLVSGLAAVFARSGGQPFQQEIITYKQTNPPIYDPTAISVARSGSLQTPHVILMPLRRAFANMMPDVFDVLLEKAIDLNAVSLALPPIGCGGFRLDRGICANALADALRNVQNFGTLNSITIVDSNRHSVDYFHTTMQLMISTDQQAHPHQYGLAPPQQAAGGQVQPAPVPAAAQVAAPSQAPAGGANAQPFGMFWIAFSKQQWQTARNEALIEARKLKDAKKGAAAAGGANSSAATDDEPTNANDEEANVEEMDKYLAACPICLQDMLEAGKDAYKEDDDTTMVSLVRCFHRFHRGCLIAWLKTRPQCPICNMNYMATHGSQPTNGTMRHELISRGRLPGYESVRGYLQIKYSFPSGVQSIEHPRPGVPYTGTTRRCYLPNTPEGERVLQLLHIAFVRRLVFTVGDSITSNQMNVVTWNGIHHKTRTSGGAAAYGYPDATYLDRVKEELAAVGITEDLLNEDDIEEDDEEEEE